LPLSSEIELRATGVDEVLVWPQPSELLAARLHTILRRVLRPETGPERPEAPLQVGDLVIEAASRRVLRGGKVIRLTDTELELLQLLARNVGKPVSREEIFQELRGFPYDGLDRSIDLRISRLRRKLQGRSRRPG
jgi:two-component system OmpR family response regulator